MRVWPHLVTLLIGVGLGLLLWRGFRDIGADRNGPVGQEVPTGTRVGRKDRSPDCDVLGAANPTLERAVVDSQARFVERWGLPIHPRAGSFDGQDVTALIGGIQQTVDVSEVHHTCDPFPCRFRLVLDGGEDAVAVVKDQVKAFAPHATVSVVGAASGEQWWITVTLLDEPLRSDEERKYQWWLASLLNDDTPATD